MLIAKKGRRTHVGAWIETKPIQRYVSVVVLIYYVPLLIRFASASQHYAEEQAAAPFGVGKSHFLRRPDVHNAGHH